MQDAICGANVSLIIYYLSVTQYTLVTNILTQTKSSQNLRGRFHPFRFQQYTNDNLVIQHNDFFCGL